MPDDPNKKGQDRKRVSQQPHEQAYQKRKTKSKSDSEEKASPGSKKANQKSRS